MLKQFLEAKPVNGRRVRIKNEREYVWLFPVEQLHIGDVVRVFPEERIPMDGVISKGESNITSSVIAGESVIVGKKAGDGVQCGTINCSAVIDIKVTAEFYNSSLQQRINRLQELRMQASWWERLVNCFRGINGQEA